MLRRSLVRGYSTAASTSTEAISSTLLLSRNPIISADLPDFEALYYKYQNELWKRLMWTFPKWYYYRPGTLSEQRYRELNKPPVFNNPNIEFPEGRPEIRHQRDRRFKQEIRLPKTYKESGEPGEETEVASSDDLSRKIVPNSRTTEADNTNDLSSLERKLSRTLYLIIKENGSWSLPNFAETSEKVTPLHELAEQGLYKLGGEQINYFNVSSKPCHYFNNETSNKKEFFIKSHILSGDFKPQDSKVEHMWLTKEELGEHLDNTYYQDIKHLLNDV